MFGIFGKRAKKPGYVVVTLNARLRPVDRGEIEDAFNAAMAKYNHGMRVIGGETSMQETGEIRDCDIEIELDDLTDKSIDLITSTLEAMLAPKGSRLHIPDRDKRIDFGAQEGLALYLNGTDLPDEVYRSSDSNHVYDECNRLLDGVGRVSSHWQGPTETALYMYGANFESMRTRLASFLQTYPLCQKCRVERIA